MATKNLDAYKLGVVLDASGAAKGIAALKDADKSATKTYSSLTQLSKGFKFGLADKFKAELKETENLSRSSGVGKVLGGMVGDGLQNGIRSVFTASNLGRLIGTAVAPGLGTVVGSIIGSGVDAALSKISGPLLDHIQNGIALNKQLEIAKLHFTQFSGSEADALKHLDALKQLSKDAGLDLPQLLQADTRLEEFNKNLALSALELRAAADQSAKFYGTADGLDTIADALGLIAERGELSSKNLLKLYRVGVDVPKLLSQATGYDIKKVKALIKAGKVNGTYAAQAIAEGIEVNSGGYAQTAANTTLAGRERQNAALQASLDQRGTVNITEGMKDSYGLVNSLLASGAADKTVAFIDHAAGSLKNLIEVAVKTGYSATDGLIEGMLDTGNMAGGISNFVSKFTDSLTSPAGFDINSPSKKMIPVGEDAAEGVVVGFENYMAGEGGQRLAASVSGVSARTRAELLLQNPRVRAMLDAIGYSEGTDKRYGYATKVGGGNQGSLDRKDRSVVNLGRGLRSSASGRYQFLNSTWDTDAGALGLSDFSPHSQDLAAVFELMKSGAISPLLNGNFGGAVGAARHVWASFPGAGYGQGERSLSSLQGVYNHSLAVGGVDVSASNPLPVVVSGDITGGVGVFASSPAAAQRSYAQTVKDTIPIIENVTAAQDEFIADAGRMTTGVTVMQQSLLPVPGALENSARATYQFSMSQEEYAKKLFNAGGWVSRAVTNIGSALGQVAGMMPSGGQVGKKRGFFSKLLGFAAPFLSFIPGVGPLLSTIAGMGSNALAGNWSGVVTGLAGGLAPGGVFRTHNNSGAGPTLGDTSVSDADLFGGHRAAGGPVRRGRAYVVGEHRAEVFTPDSDGWIHPSKQSYAARFGDHGDSGVGAILARIEEHFARLASTPMDHVFTYGARNNPGAVTDAFMRHGARDPRVIEWMSRRTQGI